jgi:hypothetical protein
VAPRGNSDDNLDAGDYIVLKRLASGVISPTPLELILGDINENGDLDAGDVTMLERLLLGPPSP